MLRDRRQGNNRLVRANTEHPLWPLMSQIVVETYGPASLLRNLLAELAGIREAYIYGSWAGRRAGQPGPPPRDIDVLVVGNPSRTDLLDVADAAGISVSSGPKAGPASEPTCSTPMTRPPSLALAPGGRSVRVGRPAGTDWPPRPRPACGTARISSPRNSA